MSRAIVLILVVFLMFASCKRKEPPKVDIERECVQVFVSEGKFYSGDLCREKIANHDICYRHLTHQRNSVPNEVCESVFGVEGDLKK